MVRNMIELLFWEFERGRRPSELVKQGFPKSTVYYAYKRWLQMKSTGLPPLKVFISHSVSDLNLVIRMHDVFSAAGLTVYVAELNPLASKKVEDVIRDSDFFVAFLTKNGQRLSWVNYEIGLAKGLNKPIIPLVEEGAELPPYLDEKEVLFFNREALDETLERVIDYLNNVRREKAQATFISALVALGLMAIVGVSLIGLLGLLASEKR